MVRNIMERILAFFKMIFGYLTGESSQKDVDEESALGAANTVGQRIVNAQQDSAPVSGTTGIDVARKLRDDGGL